MLWEDGEFVLARAVRGEQLPPLLTMTPASLRPTPDAVLRLEHAYALRDELDSTWASRPLALVRCDGRPTLVLEDPGGEVLAGLTGRQWEVASFLRIAIGLAAALGRLHARGVIHKAIRPANVLVNVATGQVWLTGFGVASRLPRERQATEPAQVNASTLAYIPPEQTGFVDRYASNTGKTIRMIDKRTFDLVQSYRWPGNVRELQNVVERAVIVCETDTLVVDENWLSRETLATDAPTQPLADALVAHERELVEAALAHTKGKVSGQAGAAAILGIPASTLESKIRALKIRKNQYKRP